MCAFEEKIEKDSKYVYMSSWIKRKCLYKREREGGGRKTETENVRIYLLANYIRYLNFYNG